MRLIDADALKEYIGTYDGTTAQVEAVEVQYIDKAPTIDDLSAYSDRLWQKAYERGKAEGRKTGHWYEKRIDEQYGNPPHGFLTRYEWRCSECEDVPCYEHDIHTLNFCPNCGAKMTKEKENNES